MREENVGKLPHRPLPFISLLLIVAAHLLSAGVGDWKNFTSQRSVRAVAADGNTVWAATSGGIFRFQPSDSTYRQFLNSDGLSTNDAVSIFVDSFGDIWVGHQNGSIDIYTPGTGRWRYVSNIRDDNSKSNKAINAFAQDGDKMYIAAGFGVTLFSIAKFEFSDTYQNFSTITQPAVRSVAVFQQRIFAATPSGIVASKSGAVNLAAPESWQIFSPVITTVNALQVFNGRLFASSADGLYEWNGTSWQSVGGIVSSVRIVGVSAAAMLLSIGSELRSFSTSSTMTTISAAVPAGVTGGTVLENGTVFLGFSSGGIGTLSAGVWNNYFPNGPSSNLFYRLAVDNDGILWGVSGRSNGSGFYRFNGTEWKNYDKGNTALLLSNDCFDVSIGPNNSKWISTWGEGLLLLNSAGVPVRRFDFDSPGFIGVVRDVNQGIPSFTVPAGIAVDASGAVWAMLYASLNSSKVLWKMNPDSSWESFAGHPFGATFSYMFGITIDRNQTKWFANSINDRFANTDNIFYYNEKRSLPNTVNNWNFLSKNDGLTNTQTQAMMIDREGDLWIGTGAGLYVVSQLNDPSSRITRVFHDFLNDEYINAVAVDPENNKWIAAKGKGVFVLSPDGRTLLHHYTVSNTGGKLVDDNVISMAFDGKRGFAYFGTEKGLSSLEVTAIETKKSFTTIDLSPNPVYLPDQQQVEIRGLVEESTVKILLLNGKVIRQFPAQGGGRAFWDCRDTEGRPVASGIYIVVAHNRSGEQTAAAKVAVIRK